MTRNEEHLRLLSIFHYVVSALAALFACIPTLYLVIGLFFLLAPQQVAGKGGPPPPFIGWFFVIFGSVAILLGLTFAAFVLAAGRALARRKHYMFCLVMGGVECVFMPFGTVLGVFTLVVLTQAAVKQLFNPSNITSN